MRTERGLACFWVGVLGWLTLGNVPLLAQSVIVPDETLGSERSQPRREMIRGVDSDRIEGGARRGGNLFHSFTQFDVGAGRGAYFSNPAGVENVFSRITGNVPSNIQGTLGVIQEGSTAVLGNANLFLINPNGIVFRAGARLDLGGSFVGTTADGVGFGTLGSFRASGEATPELLTVNPSAFLFSKTPSGSIVSLSSNLRVSNGSALTLLGGNVSVGDSNTSGAQLNAYEGRVEIGSVNGIGTVELNANGSLKFPVALSRGDVTFTNQSLVDVTLNQDGDIGVTAGDIDISGESFLKAGIDFNSGAQGSQAGDLTLDASDSVIVANGFIRNDIFSGGLGNAGNLTIRARNLTVDNGQISASTSGVGNAGNLTIDATDSVNLSGEVSGSDNGNGFPGGLFAQVNSTGVGDGGDLMLRTNHLSVSDGSKIQVATFGQGNAGNLFIDTNTIDVFDTEQYNFYSTGIIADVSTDASDDNRPTGTGNGGNITIETGRFSIRGGQVTASTSGVGNAGNLTIRARSLTVNNGQISASTFGVGNAGNLTIDATDSVNLSGEVPGSDNGNGSPGGLFAQVESTGIGEGGNLTLRTNHLSVSDGSKIQVATFGQGDAGDLFIDADTINVFDTEQYNFYSTGIIADVSTDASDDNRPTGTGNGGNITIETGRFSICGGQVTADTDGKGNAGTLRIHARDSIEIGRTSPSGSRGFLTADVNEGATGQGGTLIIETGDLIIRDNGRVSTNTYGTGNAGDLTITARNVNVEGSQISSSTFGRGNAGNLSIRASNSIVLSGENPGTNGGDSPPGGLLAQVNSTGVGYGGNLMLRTNHLSISDGSKIQVATFGQGNAGDLFIRANTTNVRETRRPNSFTTGIFAGIQTDPQATNPPIGNGGRVAIRTDRLRINGGEISANTAGQGNAGRLSIRARDRIDIIGTSPDIERDSLISTDVAPNATGRGGRISINTRQLNVREGGRISARTEGQRRAGDIVVRSDELSLLNGTISTATTSQSRGRGGDITINAGNLELNDRSRITASTQGQGRSGNVSITSDNISVSDGGRILTSTNSSNRRSRAGDITIQNSEDVNLNGRRSRIFTGTESNTTANGGNVELATDTLNISDRARISAQSDGTGLAGDITINASGQAQLTNGNIITSAIRSSGGNIRINGDAPITLEGNSQITTDSQGNGGNISLDAPGIVAFDTSDILARSTVERGGRIELAPFFGEDYQPDVPVEGDRINVNASGGLEDGDIQTPDTSFVQNSLANIPEVPINTDRLLANSCIVRDRQQGQFIITSSGGLPDRPGNPTTAYPTGTVQTIPIATTSSRDRSWQMGDPIIEPQGVYRLANGRLVMSQECS